MSMFSRLFGAGTAEAEAELLPAIERAVDKVEPLLRQAGGYPSAYRDAVAAALEYAHALAAKIPGPIEVSREAYVGDALVHALFPSAAAVDEALGTSQCIREYLRREPETRELYALMGVRRMEKNQFGMELLGQYIQRDVPQQVVFFTSHTLDSPATSEQQSRQHMAMEFFDKLVGKVAARVDKRKKRKQRLMEQKDRLMAQLRMAGDAEKEVLQKKINSLLGRMQALTRTLDLRSYARDFHTVMTNAGNYLRLVQRPLYLDSMGIRRNEQHEDAVELQFSELIGFDRRLWTVTMVHFREIHIDTFANMLDKAYRGLVFEWLEK